LRYPYIYTSPAGRQAYALPPALLPVTKRKEKKNLKTIQPQKTPERNKRKEKGIKRVWEREREL
jgi:hypothetical protein